MKISSISAASPSASIASGKATLHYSAAERKAAWVEGKRGMGFALPALLWTTIFFVFPFVATAVWSFLRRDAGQIVVDPGMQNYMRFFGEASLVKSLWNSLEVAGLVTVLSVIVAYPIAYTLAYQVPARWRRMALVLMVLPFWTSYVVRSYAWLLVLAPNGIVNQILLGLGVTDAPLRLAYNEWATVTGFVHFFAMLVTLTVFANLAQINPRYRLAATDLGASPLQAFLRITLPLSIPGIAVGAFLTFVLCIGDYVTPQILGGNLEMVMPQAILFQITRRADLPMASAMSLVLMAVVAAGYLAAARWLKMDRV